MTLPLRTIIDTHPVLPCSSSAIVTDRTSLAFLRQLVATVAVRKMRQMSQCLMFTHTNPVPMSHTVAPGRLRVAADNCDVNPPGWFANREVNKAPAGHSHNKETPATFIRVVSKAAPRFVSTLNGPRSDCSDTNAAVANPTRAIIRIVNFVQYHITASCLAAGSITLECFPSLGDNL